MKIIGIVFVFIITLLGSSRLSAQVNLFNAKDLSNINIDDYSDDDINAMLSKANASGISESQMVGMLSNRGLPAAEITKLKNRLQFLNKGKAQVQSGEFEQPGDSANQHLYDTAGTNIPLQKFKNDQEIFGSELFTSNSLVFEPNLRIPAPSNYILGPDDEIIVSVYGYSEKQYNLTVNEQGEVYIPNVGPILVSGLSIEQAGEKIKSKLGSTIYRAINSGQTKVQISLGKIRSIRVTVIGQAKKPGTFTVSSLTTLYNILYLCGGPTTMGSFRAIEVIRGNNVKRTADLYDFLVEGNQSGNILLQEGDVIRIPYYKNRVTLSGNVKREGKFEMLADETFNDLLKYSGGFTDNAYRGAVTVIRVTDTEKKILDLGASHYNAFTTNGSDEYIVGKLQEEFGNKIVIAGAVLRPGPYELTPGTTVKDLVEKAGGLTVDAYTQRVTVFRYFANKIPTILSINLDSVLNYNQAVLLKKNDSVYIHSIFEFRDDNNISVEGNVRKPGVVQWRENLTLRDLLLSVGGLTESGDSSNIEISRRIKNASIDKANHNESRIIRVDLTSESTILKNISLEPFDIVIVKTRPDYVRQRSVLLLGEVKSPGRYGLAKSGEKISDILERAGGFKASADSTSITIRRSVKSNLTIEERQKLFQRILNINSDSLAQNPRLKDELYKSYDLISVDLERALTHPGSSENLALEEGDVLTIDRSTNLVKVSGEVYYPTIVPYKSNKNLKYYVQQAGNFTPYARKTGALVIHPDGKAESVKHFLWFKSYPSVTPRSEIFVPQKLKNNRAKIGAAEWALIVSALGIIANVIITATK
ncbi:MAG: SLBB domain-containing protein [Bacteroidota bacterium]|nr:SLBB domain-containing protein [Bacteroidota bacterium]